MHRLKHRIKHHIHRHVGVHHISTWKSFLLFAAIVICGTLGIAYSIKAYPEIFKSEISVKNNFDVPPGDAIIVDFSFPMRRDAYSSGIGVVPSAGYSIHWLSARQLAIIPKDSWQLETDYKIFLPETKNSMFSTVKSHQVTFSTEKYPKVSQIFPEDGTGNASIDIEEPIVVNFNGSTSNFDVVFSLDPEKELAFQINPQSNQFKVLPKEKLQGGEKYQLNVYARYATNPEANYKLISQTTFTTQMPSPISLKDKYDLRLANAEKNTSPKIRDGKYIDINLKEQVLSYFENGKVLGSFMISSGKKGMDTPKGETKIYNKFPRAYSKAYGLFMPYWMAMSSDGKFGIHELPEWPNGYKEGEAHLGTPVSHGCVRLGVGPANKIYEWAEIGTPVVIY